MLSKGFSRLSLRRNFLSKRGSNSAGDTNLEDTDQSKKAQEKVKVTPDSDSCQLTEEKNKETISNSIKNVKADQLVQAVNSTVSHPDKSVIQENSTTEEEEPKVSTESRKFDAEKFVQTCNENPPSTMTTNGLEAEAPVAEATQCLTISKNDVQPNEDGKYIVVTGPNPVLNKPLKLSELPNISSLEPEQQQKLQQLREEINALPIIDVSPEEAQQIQQLLSSERSGSGWFSNILGKSNSTDFSGALESLCWDEVLWLMEDATLWRYLRSYSWDIPETKKYLMQTLQWRRSRLPHRIHPDIVQPAAVKGNIYRKGYDNEGRPLIYFRPGVEASTATKAAQLHSIYTMERAMQSLDKSAGCDQLVFLLDFSGWGISQVPTMDLSKEVVNILSDHYTDTLAVCYILNAPGYFDACWSIIKLMLHENTNKKIKFVQTTKEKDLNFLKSQIPEKYLEDYLGGLSVVSYDHDAYWNSEKEQFTTFIRFQDEQIEELKNDPELRARVISQ